MPDQRHPEGTASIPNTESADLRRQPVGRPGFIEAFSAFSHRNYRIFFGGQVISLIGTWLQTTAEGWLVYELSGSSVALGLIRFANMLPFALLALWGGIVADRISRRKILIFTQSASMILALLLALLVYLKVIEVWHVAVIGMGLGIANAFDVPARQSFVVDLVGKEDLINGIALNSSMFNLARVAGPAMAGALIGIVGMAGCFLVNGLSYIAVIFSYSKLDLPKFEKRTDNPPFLQAIREAYCYIAKDPPLRAIMILVSTFSMFGMSFNVLMPVFAKDVLHGDAKAFGILMAFNGLGALIGGLSLASKGKAFERRTLVYFGLFGCCVFLSIFAISKIFWLSCAMLVISGFFMIIFLASANTGTQLRSPDALRGRIMGFYSLCFLGMSSVGGLMMGALAKLFGAPTAVVIGMTICLIVGILFAGRIKLTPKRRRG
ncbi:MFS transporter [Luteolibacter sp. AS25]|uniref:MFS transporter n=1 Tax=Luteolibacter sp. AS25 TaxID=3135776 RepID=UPI00398B480B